MHVAKDLENIQYIDAEYIKKGRAGVCVWVHVCVYVWMFVCVCVIVCECVCMYACVWVYTYYVYVNYNEKSFVFLNNVVGLYLVYNIACTQSIQDLQTHHFESGMLRWQQIYLKWNIRL